MTMQGSELKAIREQLGLSQIDFAERLGMSQTFIGLMERGERPVEPRTALAAEVLAGGPSRVNVGTFGDKFVVIAVEMLPGLPGRAHRILPPGYDTLDEAIDAAEEMAAKHNCPYLPTGVDQARLAQRRAAKGHRRKSTGGKTS